MPKHPEGHHEGHHEEHHENHHEGHHEGLFGGGGGFGMGGFGEARREEHHNGFGMGGGFGGGSLLGEIERGLVGVNLGGGHHHHNNNLLAREIRQERREEVLIAEDNALAMFAASQQPVMMSSPYQQPVIVDTSYQQQAILDAEYQQQLQQQAANAAAAAAEEARRQQAYQAEQARLAAERAEEYREAQARQERARELAAEQHRQAEALRRQQEEQRLQEVQQVQQQFMHLQALWLDAYALPHNFSDVLNHYLKLPHNNSQKTPYPHEEKVWMRLIRSSPENGVKLFEHFLGHNTNAYKMLELTKCWLKSLTSIQDILDACERIKNRVYQSTLYSFKSDFEKVMDGCLLKHVAESKESDSDDTVKRIKSQLESTRTHFYSIGKDRKHAPYTIYHELRHHLPEATAHLNEELEIAAGEINADMAKADEPATFRFG